ncbi:MULTISPECIES: DUF739 family protein [Enterococcus]|uniref:DUF739 family protein n=1 Tax=Enterococcus TaxID=1350 RepID=UPI00100E0733|nr:MULTISPECIES: DUF739 family protein [Enterococcus]EMF0257391.1 DUF739 family protein [Enterococcus hirae]MDT2663208.1 DUF739 family protein [Enterococcus hirae]MDT2836224.1 DUF739 family protein [Enterococcus durans]MDV7749222.1 DUF739 family protein [Enterococcus faecium]MDW3623117.1 DUF739 family protein [Enterococcus faecium]
MSYDYSSLSGKIVEKFGTQFNFAVAMGLSERTVSLKINGKVAWKDDDIVKACKLLDIDLTDMHKYFFKPKVHV